LTERAAKHDIPIIEAPKGRRDEFVDPYFRRAKPGAVAVILKAREPARIMTGIGDKAANRWHLQMAERWVVQYNFYVNDRDWGRMFMRICPNFPFSARICLDQHHWLANRMRENGIQFKQCSNAFLKCAAPDRLQQLADSLTPRDLVTCGQKRLAQLTPSSTQESASRRAASIGCSSRRSSTPTTLSSVAALHWTCSANACLTPIEPSDDRTRSRSSSAARSPSTNGASYKPRSRT
jgi:hypothetical protein